MVSQNIHRSQLPDGDLERLAKIRTLNKLEQGILVFFMQTGFQGKYLQFVLAVLFRIALVRYWLGAI